MSRFETDRPQRNGAIVLQVSVAFAVARFRFETIDGTDQDKRDSTLLNPCQQKQRRGDSFVPAPNPPQSG